MQLGALLAGQGKPAKALEMFDRTVRSQPACLSAHIMRSQVLTTLGKTEEAEATLKQLVGVAFDHPEVWSALSMNLYRQGKLQVSCTLLLTLSLSLSLFSAREVHNQETPKSRVQMTEKERSGERNAQHTRK